MEAVDHHAVLGVPVGATAEQIRVAYQARLHELRLAVRSGNPPSAEVVDRLRKAFIVVYDEASRPRSAAIRPPQAETTSADAAPTAGAEPAATDVANDAAFAPAATAESPGRSEFPLKFVGAGSEYFRIWIVNLFLTIVTLGIYSVWAKVRRERYLHNSMMLDGSGFDYHGSPTAILKGRIVAVLILAALSFAQQLGPQVHGGMMLLLTPLVPWLAVRAFRFRAHNTSYRGIRFAFHGTYREAMVAIIGYGFLTLLTLGLAYPYWYAKLRLFVVNNLAYGTAPVASPASAGGIARALVLPMLGASALFVVLGLSFAAMIAALVPDAQAGAAPAAAGQAASPFLAIAPLLLMMLAVSFMLFVKGLFAVRVGNLLLNGATVDTLEMRSRLALGPYVAIALQNWLLILLSLGLYLPYAQMRMARYRAEAASFMAQGGLDAFVADEHGRVSALGDEASEIFDLDIAL